MKRRIALRPSNARAASLTRCSSPHRHSFRARQVQVDDRFLVALQVGVALFAGVQGAGLLTNAFRDANILTRQGRDLERWIDSF